MTINIKSSYGALLYSFLLILSVGGCVNTNSDPTASTPTTRTERNNDSDPAASTPTTRTERDNDSEQTPPTEEEEEKSLEWWRVVVAFLMLLALGGGGFLLFPLVQSLLESEDSKARRRQNRQTPVFSSAPPSPQKDIPRILKHLDSLESRVRQLTSEVENLKSQQSTSLIKPQRDEHKTFIQAADYYAPSIVQAPPVDPLQVVIDAFNQQNADFFGQSYPINPTQSTMQGQSSGTRRIVQFESAGTHRDAAYIAVQQGQSWLIVPNFEFSYYQNPEYWLYGNEDIFAYSGTGYTVQLIKPAKAQFVQAQRIWKLAEAGSCILR